MKNKILVGIVTLLALLGLLWIHLFIYPFTTSHPNFSDVEKTFNNLPIPKDWKLISKSENKGIAGRACPIEGSGCFSKRAVYELPPGTDVNVMTDSLRTFGCGPISVTDTSTKSAKMYTYNCNLAQSVKLGSDFNVESREATLRIFTN